MIKWFLIVFATYNVFSQNETELTHLSYKEHPNLIWEDFQAVPPLEGSEFAASVNTGIAFSWSYTTVNNIPELEYNVFCYVYPKLSWVVEKEKDAELLAHEQLHFDISEIHARILRKRISEYEIKRNIRKSLKYIHGEVEGERHAMQELYDEETNHSKNIDKQKEWELKVAQLLKEYEMYLN